jgi:hypothetical protein
MGVGVKRNGGLIVYAINSRTKQDVAGTYLNQEVVVGILLQFEIVLAPTRLAHGLR